MDKIFAVLFLILTIGYPLFLILPIQKIRVRNFLKIFFSRATFCVSIILTISSYHFWWKKFLDFNILTLPLGFLGGWFCASVSCIVTNKFRDILIIPINLVVKIKDICFWSKILLMSVIEEIIWRIVIGSCFFSWGIKNIIIIILLVSILFTLSHFRPQIKYFQLLDLFIFSLILEIIFYFTRSIYLIIITHFVRNIFIYSLRKGKRYD